jgi:hypothetical protein
MKMCNQEFDREGHKDSQEPPLPCTSPPVGGDRGGAPLAGAAAAGGRSRLDIYDKLKENHVRGYGGLNSMDLPTEYEIKNRKKRGHFYFALMSGLIYHQDDDIRFLTLTSPPNSVYLPESFNRFRMALGYQEYKFDFINLRTAEGNGVLHIVAAGDYLPVTWLRETWNRVHGAPSGYFKNLQMDIKLINQEKTEPLQRYLLGQYLKNQDGFIRYSLSRGWLWKGYRRDWLNLVHREGFQEAKCLWRDRLEAKVTTQTIISHGDIEALCSIEPSK